MNQTNLQIPKHKKKKAKKTLTQIKIEIATLEAKARRFENEMNYTDAQLIRKKILKLRKKEQSSIMSKFIKEQEKEKNFLVNKFNDTYSNFHSKKREEMERFTKTLQRRKKIFNISQKLERKFFKDNFLEEYPKEPSYKNEELIMKDKIKFFARQQDYKRAQSVKQAFTMEKEKKHQQYIEEREEKLKKAKSQLKDIQKKEKKANKKKINDLIFEFNLKKNNEYKRLEDIQFDKFNTLKKLQNLEVNRLACSLNERNYRKIKKMKSE